MDAKRLARRGADLCHEVAEGHHVVPDLLELLAETVGADLVSYASFAVGSTLSVPEDPRPLLFLHGCAPLSEELTASWDRLLPTHPYAAHLATSPTPSPRLTDVVDLVALERTEVFTRCLQPFGARFQCGVPVVRSAQQMVLLCLWRDREDFHHREVEAVQLLGRALAAAMEVGSNLQALRALAGPSSAREVLTPRQSQVAALVALGLTNEQIAHRLGLTVRTVRKHLEEAFARTGARSRTELAVRFRHRGPAAAAATAAG